MRSINCLFIYSKLEENYSLFQSFIEMSDKNPDYIENKLDSNWDQNEEKAFKEFLVKKIVFLSDQIWNNVSQRHDFKEDNIYWGDVGIAYMYWHLSQQTFLRDKQREDCLSIARTLISRSLNAMVAQRIERSHSFLFGNSGICLMAGLIFNSCGDHKSRDHYLNLFVKFSAYYLTIDFNDKQRDTLLEGRAGFICAALTANHTLNSHIISPQILQNIGISVIKSGLKYRIIMSSKLFNSLIFELKANLTL